MKRYIQSSSGTNKSELVKMTPSEYVQSLYSNPIPLGEASRYCYDNFGVRPKQIDSIYKNNWSYQGKFKVGVVLKDGTAILQYYDTQSSRYVNKKYDDKDAMLDALSWDSLNPDIPEKSSSGSLEDLIDGILYQTWENYRRKGYSISRVGSIVWEHVVTFIKEEPEEFPELAERLTSPREWKREDAETEIATQVRLYVKEHYDDYDWE